MNPDLLVAGPLLAEQQANFPAEQPIWALHARGFAALAEASGFNVIVGGNDWVTVTATSNDPATLHLA
ncbi:hypothetical protein [Falsiroseomonas sp. E2-1-a4]|uniref:hypothetical protein n=1 Tax=Falsiroseomonas sp. E2-1-a4 TaxID=3239299 RepID=UPI003F2DD3CC